MATLQVPTVSLSAFAYLFSELIQYAMDRASSTTDLEERCADNMTLLFECIQTPAQMLHSHLTREVHDGVLIVPEIIVYRTCHSRLVIHCLEGTLMHRCLCCKYSWFRCEYSAFASTCAEYDQTPNPHPAVHRRLDKVGHAVGMRVLELLSYREKLVRRKPEILDILRYIHSTAWPYMFGKNADDLQQAAAVSAGMMRGTAF